MGERRRSATSSLMTALAMPHDKLDLWLAEPARDAANLSIFDGFVTAIVAGPRSIDPPERICPLLGIEIDASNHSGTPEYTAIYSVAVPHHAIVETLSTAPKMFEPIFIRPGFYTAMNLRVSARASFRDSRLGRSNPAGR